MPKPTTPQTRLCVLQELDPELLAFPANNLAKVGLAGHAQFEEFRHLRDVRWADLGALAGEIKNIAMHNLIILRGSNVSGQVRFGTPRLLVEPLSLVAEN